MNNEKMVKFKVGVKEYEYAIEKFTAFCQCMEEYANRLYYIPASSDIGIRLDSDKTHRNTVELMLSEANNVLNVFFEGFYRSYDEATSIIGTDKKLEELANYHFDLRTAVVANNMHLNDKDKSCDLFNDFLIHSEGFVSKINYVLDKIRINHSTITYNRSNIEEGYYDIRYHIIDNIDIRITIDFPTKSDNIVSDRYSNCMRFIASLYVTGDIEF